MRWIFSSGSREDDGMNMDQALLNRPVNAGFSGGEKKRNEIFNAVLERAAGDSGRDGIRDSTLTRIKLGGGRRECHAQRPSAHGSGDHTSAC